MHFSKEIGESLTYKFAQAAGEMKAQGREIISLGLGEPDFATPSYVTEATIQAIRDGFTHYSASQGLPELRNLIATDITTNKGVEYTGAQVIITPGIKAAVYFALCAVLEPFDKVINIAPYYVSYPAMMKLAEPTAEIINVEMNQDFTLNMAELEKAFAQNPKCILVNTPNNPTGTVFSKAEVERIIELAIEHHTYIIADEVYEKLVYSGYVHTSFASYEKVKDQLILCNGFSKSHAMTGYRLGYAAGPKQIIAKMNKLQQHINTNTCTFIQKGACAIFTHEADHLPGYVRELEQRVRYFDEKINKLSYMKGVVPKGGFFYFADISATRMDSNSFCVKLLNETGIACTPGIAFGANWDNYVRFSLAVSMATIERAVKLMENLSI